MSTITTRAAIARGPHIGWEIVDLRLDPPKAHEVRVKIMAAGLCHSDDHITAGDAPVRMPVVGGHEGAGIVESVGPDVQRVKPGDKVVLSYIPACGACRPCSTGHSNMCVKGLNAGTGMFEDGTWRFHEGETDIGGFCSLGTFSQYAVVSEYATVPLREDFQDIPFELLCLVGCGVPTGFGSAVHAAGVQVGDTVVIFGAGGVGSNAIQGARYAGAANVIVVDPVPFKREMAREFGATDIVTERGDDGVARIKELTGGLGAHSVIEAVGMEAHGDPFGNAAHRVAALLPDAVAKKVFEKAGIDRLRALYDAIATVRRGGTLSISGVYGGALDPLPMMDLFDKQIQIRMGQANVKRWIEDIMPLLTEDGDPLGTEDFATHKLPLEQAPGAYEMFQKKEDGAIKVLLQP